MISLFESKKTKEIKSHIANLVAIAKSDGDFAVSEKKFIFDLGVRKGLSAGDVKSIIRAEKHDFDVPANDELRFEQVYDLVQMVLADGVCTEEELDMCIELAEKLGVKKSVAGVMVRKMIMDLTSDSPLTHDEIKEEFSHFMNYSVEAVEA